MEPQKYEGRVTSLSRSGGGIEVTTDIRAPMGFYDVAFIVPIAVGQELIVGQRLRFTVEKVEETPR